jgi:hypothetical protein
MKSAPLEEGRDFHYDPRNLDFWAAAFKAAFRNGNEEEKR